MTFSAALIRALGLVLPSMSLVALIGYAAWMNGY